MKICGRCLKEFPEHYIKSSGCNEKPEEKIGQPIGMYHCPECDTMLVAGVKHLPICIECKRKINNKIFNILVNFSLFLLYY